MTTLKSLFYFVIFNWKQQIIHKKEFLIRFFLTALNSVTLFVFWIVYSHKYPSINGWTIKEIAVLYAVTHMVMGWLSLLGLGCLDLVYYYHRGDFSREMNDPGPSMMRMILKGSSFQGISSILLGVMYYVFSGHMNSFSDFMLILITSLLGAFVMICFFTIINSFVISIVDASVLVDQIYEVTLLFMMYPKSLFAGVVKIACLTIVPVFWIVHFPAEITIKPEAGPIAILLLVAVFCFLICALSMRHLRRFILSSGD